MIIATCLSPAVRAPDTTPPWIGTVLVFPQAQVDRPAVGDRVLIQVSVTDDTLVAWVSVNVTQPDGAWVNASMVPGAPPRYEYWNPWPQAGPYALTVWAADASGNAASAAGSFTMLPQDVTPPTISGAIAYPSSEPAGGPVTVSATIADDRAVVWAYANYTLPDGTTQAYAPFLAHGDVYYQTWFWNQVGVYNVTIVALDHGGNRAYASTAFRLVGADTSAPVIAGAGAAPSPQTAGSAVTVFATITDDAFVASATVVVTRPDGTPVVASMAASGDVYAYTAVWDDLGTYAFTITARDGAGNVATASGSFVVRGWDAAPPTIAPMGPDGAVVGDGILVTATVTDDDPVREVRIVYTTVDGETVNVTMARAGDNYTYWIPAQDVPGTVRYRIFALDASGNSRLSPEYAIAVGMSPIAPEIDAAQFAAMLSTSIVVLAAVVAAIYAAATFAARRKRSKTAPRSVAKRP